MVSVSIDTSTRRDHTQSMNYLQSLSHVSWSRAHRFGSNLNGETSKLLQEPKPYVKIALTYDSRNFVLEPFGYSVLSCM